ELTRAGSTDEVAAEATADDPAAGEADAEDPNAEDPAAADPSAEDPNAEEPAAEDPSAEDPSAEGPTATDDPALADESAPSEGTADDELVTITLDPIAIGLGDGEDEGPDEAPSRRRRVRAPSGPPGTVDVVTPGGWADIFVRNRRVGRSPGTLELPPGRHVLVLRPFGTGS